MPAEPATKRAAVFVDGQNLFYAAKLAFGYSFPNYDIPALSEALCRLAGWHLTEVRFYTGVPDPSDNQHWHQFWAAKLAVMGTRGVVTYQRQLKYRTQTVVLPGGSSTAVRVGQEKGIDIRIALDAVRLARAGAYDVALLLSQDQDLSEVADEIRAISMDQRRWIKVASAYPMSPTYSNRRGVNKTDWVPFDRSLYDSCLDPGDYRGKVSP